MIAKDKYLTRFNRAHLSTAEWKTVGKTEMQTINNHRTEAKRNDATLKKQDAQQNSRKAILWSADCAENDVNSKMAVTGFTCPIARLTTCKHILSRNLIRSVRICERVCSRHSYHSLSLLSTFRSHVAERSLSSLSFVKRRNSRNSIIFFACSQALFQHDRRLVDSRECNALHP